jgi:p-hydroxybenzoate 3-monooxygenase
LPTQKGLNLAIHDVHVLSEALARFPGDDPFQQQLQRSQLEYVVNSTAAATSLAENYVGLPVM